jgi:hypothetical protein
MPAFGRDGCFGVAGSGQNQPEGDVGTESGLPPQPDSFDGDRYFRVVPLADIAGSKTQIGSIPLFTFKNLRAPLRRPRAVQRTTLPNRDP